MVLNQRMENPVSNRPTFADCSCFNLRRAACVLRFSKNTGHYGAILMHWFHIGTSSSGCIDIQYASKSSSNAGFFARFHGCSGK